MGVLDENDECVCYPSRDGEECEIALCARKNEACTVDADCCNHCDCNEKECCPMFDTSEETQKCVLGVCQVAEMTTVSCKQDGQCVDIVSGECYGEGNYSGFFSGSSDRSGNNVDITFTDTPFTVWEGYVDSLKLRFTEPYGSWYYELLVVNSPDGLWIQLWKGPATGSGGYIVINDHPIPGFVDEEAGTVCFHEDLPDKTIHFPDGSWFKFAPS